MGRRSALVVCPGRGTYNKDELGYLARHHADKAELIGAIDAARLELGQEAVSALDGARRHTLARHTRGDNASAAATNVTKQITRPMLDKMIQRRL